MIATATSSLRILIGQRPRIGSTNSARLREAAFSLRSHYGEGIRRSQGAPLVAFFQQTLY